MIKFDAPPLVQWFADESDDPTAPVWFDLGIVDELVPMTTVSPITRLPFEECAVVFLDDDRPSLIRLTQGVGGITATAVIEDDDGTMYPLDPFSFALTPDGARHSPHPQSGEILSLVDRLLVNLGEGCMAHQMMPNGARKNGQAWRTITVFPSVDGDRQPVGHWRLLGADEIVWVKPFQGEKP